MERDTWMQTGLRNSQHFIETRLKADLKEKSHRFDFCFLIFCAVCSLRSVVSELWFHVFSMWLLCVCVTGSWHVAYAWLVHMTSIWFIYVCVCVSWFERASFPLHVFLYALQCCLCELSLLLMFLSVCVCVCLCVFLRYVQIVSICSTRFVCVCVCAVDNELFHSLFVSQMPIPPNTLELFWYFDKVLDHPL